MRPPRLASRATIAVVVLLSGCSSNGDSNRSLPGTTSSGSALRVPRIVALTGPATPVPCNAPTMVELKWEARGATIVTLRIDGGPVFATYGGGRNDKLVPLACDGKPHSYTLTARAAGGQVTTRTLRLSERAS